MIDPLTKLRIEVYHRAKTSLGIVKREGNIFTRTMEAGKAQAFSEVLGLLNTLFAEGKRQDGIQKQQIRS